MGAGKAMILRPGILDPHSFAPFGSARRLSGGVSVNENRGRRIDLEAQLQHDAEARRAALALYRMEPSAAPVSVAFFERHPCSAQLFVAPPSARFLLVVAPDGDASEPDPARALAFLGEGDWEIIYHKGVWHFPLIALGASTDFTMMMWQTGDRRDCECRNLAAPLFVHVP
ncbi:ureidoglycolate hydrolase [Alsobacter soli]|uniref:Ureidoglycolate hydrolase n=1 Tax=Alsobacter soli TaxID=2109933 RepID=A0A2T1HNM8_9HYPH|nr:ureidoglycolate lyase [Alsobacter soli]PSC03243.1 ureidoglycolate hydrolase [Alsobacter soli]